MNQRLKISILVLLAIILSACSYYLFELNSREKLWGHLPMFTFLTAWALIIGLFQKSFYKDRTHIKYLTYSTASGLMLWLGFPTMPFTFLMFFAFVPLLLVEYEISKTNDKSFWKVWRYSYHSFVLWNILSTFWVANTAFGAGIFAIMVNSLLMTIPIMLYHFSKKVLAEKFHWILLIAYWVSFEKLHQNWELSWTWLTLGNSFSMYPALIQWYEFTGVFGGGLWILGLNYLIYSHLKAEKGWSIKSLAPILFCLFVPIVVSSIMFFNYTEKGESKEIVVIQPNYEPHYEKFTVSSRQQYEQFVKLSKSSLRKGTDYLLFPETSFGRIRTNKLESQPVLLKLKKMISDYQGLKLVSGVSAHKVFSDQEEKPEATLRTHVGSKDTTFYEAYNSAIQINQEDEIQFYKKSILVPGAEIFPYKNLFFFMKPLVHSLGGTLAGNGTQKERSVFWDEGDKFAVAPVICYESIYGEYCTEYIRKGANAIFIMTNDGWWDRTAGHKQHLRFAGLRAIETRRSIARSANTGISAFINQRGQIVDCTKYGEEAGLLGEIKFNDELTFYVKWGDMIARIALLLSILFLLNTIVKSLIKK